MTNTGWPSFYIEEMTEHATSAQAMVTSFIMEGVFERYPTLKVVLIESGFAWLPALGWRLDKLWKRLKDEVPHLRRAPSEYLREHFCVSTQPMEEPEEPDHLMEMMAWIGFDRILFASDYPHWDFDDPFLALPPSLDERQRTQIYSANARAAVSIGVRRRPGAPLCPCKQGHGERTRDPYALSLGKCENWDYGFRHAPPGRFRRNDGDPCPSTSSHRSVTSRRAAARPSPVNGRAIVVFNLGGEFFALTDRCPHKGGPLSKGRLTGLLESSEPGTTATRAAARSSAARGIRGNSTSAPASRGAIPSACVRAATPSASSPARGWWRVPTGGDLYGHGRGRLRRGGGVKRTPVIAGLVPAMTIRVARPCQLDRDAG